MDDGTRPAITKLTKSVKAVSKAVAGSPMVGDSRSLMCWGKRPSEPPAEPAEKDSTDF